MFLIFAVILNLSMLFLLAWTLFPAIRKGGAWRYIAFVFLGLMAAGAAKSAVYVLCGGSPFIPGLPPWSIMIFEALYAGMITACFLLLLQMGLEGLLRLRRWSFPGRTEVRLLLCCSALFLSGWGVHEALRVPDIREVEVQGRVPEALKGMRIVQLSDLHIGPLLKREWLEKVVKKTNALKPDVILLTGDYVDGSVEKIGDMLLPLSRLKSRHGVWAVAGNHEYYWQQADWTYKLRQMGIRVLDNRNERIYRNGATLVIGGVTDKTASEFRLPPPSVDKAFLNAPQAAYQYSEYETRRSYRILLSHRPTIEKKRREGSDLILSGHTHGGSLFFLKPLIAMFNDGYVSGLYDYRDREGEKLYVSNGTGIFPGFSCRLMVPSEITCIILN